MEPFFQATPPVKDRKRGRTLAGCEEFFLPLLPEWGRFLTAHPGVSPEKRIGVKIRGFAPGGGGYL